MKFAMVIRSDDSKAVIPKTFVDGVSNLAQAHGLKLSSVIPESLMGKKFDVMMAMIGQARAQRLDNAQEQTKPMDESAEREQEENVSATEGAVETTS